MTGQDHDSDSWAALARDTRASGWQPLETARPAYRSSDGTPGTRRLREEIARTCYEADGNVEPWTEAWMFNRHRYERMAEELLDRFLAPLLAERERMRALAEELDDERSDYGYAVRNGLKPGPGDRIRSALRGDA